VPDHQLSLAIGREGQNARLAARLTGVRIDIRSETQLAEGIPARRDELEPGVEYAEGQWVANAETGLMEWHAADGSVISEAEWNAQAAAGDADVAQDAATAAAGEEATAGDGEEATAGDGEEAIAGDAEEAEVAAEGGDVTAAGEAEPDDTEPSEALES
jgi:N utilization substance protein A